MEPSLPFHSRDGAYAANACPSPGPAAARVRLADRLAWTKDGVVCTNRRKPSSEGQLGAVMTVEQCAPGRRITSERSGSGRTTLRSRTIIRSDESSDRWHPRRDVPGAGAQRLCRTTGRADAIVLPLRRSQHPVVAASITCVLSVRGCSSGAVGRWRGDFQPEEMHEVVFLAEVWREIPLAKLVITLRSG